MAGGDTWTVSESLSQYIGETREVFHRRNDRKIYYIGTYQCVKTGDFSFVDFRNLSTFAKQDLARATFVNPRAAYTAGEMKKILNMYVAGEAQTMYLALQCVGFNQPLYDALLAARPRQLVEEAEQLCAKRARDEAGGPTASGVKWTNKKPKTHHQAVVDPEVSETETNDGFCL
ncbi:hypothetical protein K474DRAFT_1667363 [Panus rudis PR-1116 ss-1]|nr:hypothetical protein K474DRAFT_1667363 [Panus rudis PR-1116 ss-1]